MAIKTNFTVAGFEYVLSQYDLGEYVRFTPFEHGADQTNMRLTTTQRDVVLRYYEKRSLDYVEFEIELLHYLAQHFYPCAAPIAGKAGKYVELCNGKPLALFEFLLGAHSNASGDYSQIAKAIGLLHKLTISYRPEHGATRPTYNAAYCWEWAQKTAKNIKPATVAHDRLGWVKQELESLTLPDTLPKGICHGDTNPTNFLYQRGQLTGVLDFDQASYTWLLYDVAQMLYWLTWPNKGDLDFGRSRKLLAAYEMQRSLEYEERTYLLDALKLVILIGISWSLEDDAGYDNAKRKVKLLNTYNRETFSGELFSERES